MQWISADIVFDGFEFHSDFFIRINEEGKIIKIHKAPPNEKVNRFKGLLMPGMVNAHCHLELSHTKGLLEKRTGLTDFLANVNKQNANVVDSKKVMESMKKADAEMHKNGIVAIGDICNTERSIDVKKESDILYHSFVECISIRSQDVQRRFEEYSEIGKQFLKSGLSASLALHAPYTCNENLFKLVNQHSTFISIHNQESEAENQLFANKEGNFDKFYKHFGLDKAEIINLNTSSNSLENTLRLIDSDKQILLVHNTYTKESEMNLAHKNVYWCFCPNANLYIENELPNIPMFLSQEEKIVLGTDSLASNDELNILSEVKTIQTHFPQIPLATILKWATINGARLFDLEDQIGSFEVGKKPGIVSVPDINISELKLKSSMCKRVNLI